jgi:hypothetical protein
MRSIYLSSILSSIALSTFACSMEAPNVGASELSGGGSNGETGGSGSVMPQAGSSSNPMNMAGSASGGVSTTAGTSSTGGVTSGGANLGGAGSGGASGSGGTGPMGGTGGSGTGGGTGDYSAVGAPLEALRIDDPCTGAPSTAAGSTCNHLMNPFHKTLDATIGGTPGTTYDVTLRIRGVVEPTKITGGTRPDMSTTMINGKTYRKVPYTVGGTPGDPTYQPWLFSVAKPAQNYFFNDYGLTEHSTFLLDYQVTIPMEGGTKVTLDVNDGNDHEIDNYAMLKNDGISGSMNLGQYIQLSVISVKPQ